jgi:GNAT superfamily N-acetyltransferase
MSRRFAWHPPVSVQRSCDSNPSNSAPHVARKSNVRHVNEMRACQRLSMRTQPQSACSRARLSVVSGTRQHRPATPARNDELSGLVRQPWLLRVDASTLLIRPSTSRDLPTVAAMHGRCSAQSLLDRYRSGGRPPAVLALDYQLRAPLSFIATTRDGEVVATAVATPDEIHGDDSAEVGILVEDAWQGLGLAREMMTHLAGGARVAGFTQLIAYPGTTVAAAQRLMVDIGRTRMVPDFADVHLHTALPEGATLGLGPVRERLVG